MSNKGMVFSALEEDRELIRILYEEEHMSVKDISVKFETNIHNMHSYIFRRGFTRKYHSAVKDLPKTSLNKVIAGEAPDEKVLHILRKSEPNKILMEESEYIKLIGNQQ